MGNPLFCEHMTIWNYTTKKTKQKTNQQTKPKPKPNNPTILDTKINFKIVEQFHLETLSVYSSFERKK